MTQILFLQLRLQKLLLLPFDGFVRYKSWHFLVNFCHFCVFLSEFTVFTSLWQKIGFYLSNPPRPSASGGYKYIAISISVPSDKFCEKIRHYLSQVQVKCVFNIHIFTLFPPFQVFFRSASVTNIHSKLTLWTQTWPSISFVDWFSKFCQTWDNCVCVYRM